ncbi:MAG: FHA domain-containing protein [Verrucomicrobia bacterium]|nr:FHA domain-containing protein [Verrucomicrobiota bacterium]NBU07604.1 FHA domain-containing protein [Pseudomonadota bacterium]NDA65323.1 FHA domain-containing protein [Verrucomicrobiota bacterium]NDD37017.1 FHA domain-containing protein [Verrucomicrobiota bacterium]NDE96880.1 FHA domain-containing protein [Verrucomicrobiota bacterium]
MAGFIILTGARRGQRYVLPPGIVTIGRQPGNTIVIADDSVANSHLLLSVDHEGCRMKDRSGGGTAVNGSHVTTAALQDGDVLKLGELELRYEAGAPIPKAAPGQAPKPTPGGLAAQIKKTGPRFEEILAEQKQLKKKVIFDIELGPILLWGSLTMLALAGIWAALHPKPIEKKARNEKKGVAAVGPYVPGVLGLPGTNASVVVVPESEPDRTNAPLGFAVAPEPPRLPYSLPVGAAKPGGGSGKIYFTSQSSGQAAVDAAQEGDAIVFDAPGGDIVVNRPLKDVQFIGGSAAWELRANLTGCQFFWHTPTHLTQTAGKLELCAFFRSHGPATQLTHADGVSFYYAGTTVLAGDFKNAASAPQLWLRGFVRGVTIHKPVIAPPEGERRWDMSWPPVVRVQPEDLAAHGHNTYFLSPHVRGQTAWMPFHVVRATGLTFAHASADGGTWADPVLEVDYGIDCAIVCTALAGRSDVATAGYLRQPDLLKYSDHEEPGHNHPAAPYRGAAIYLGGQRNRIIGQGGLRPWSLGRRAALPGLHFADGIVARDPFLQEWSVEQGGLNANFAEPKNIFQVQPRANGPIYNATTREMRVRFPVLGANLAQPVLVPLEDLRAPPPLLFGKKFSDFTGKPAAAIQHALDTGENVFLGPGDYAFTRPVTNGCLWGAGMDKTILTWPTNTDCAQRDCKGLLNLTARGGRYGYNSQAGEGGPTNTATALLLRVRFDGQSQAGITVHSVVDQSYQDCEFINGKLGFTHGHDRTRGVFYSERGPAAGPAITRLSILNCTFRNLTDRAIDLKPGAAQTGAIAIHNCVFEDIRDTAVRLAGGEAMLVQKCVFRRVGKENSTSAVVEAQGHGAVVLSHLEIENKDFPGHPMGILVSGLANVSHCSTRGVPRALVSRTAMSVDHVDAPDGNFELPYGSYVTTSTFKNADVKKGAMLVKEASQGESISLQAGVQPLDTTPPSAVPGVKVEVRADGHLITWKPATDLESGITGYLVLAGGRPIYRTPFQYDPGDAMATPLMSRVVPTEYLDTSRAAETYVVRAINGANLMSGGGQAPLPRWGPMRARFLDRSSNVVNVAEVTFKNRTPGLVDAKGRKLSAFELRRQGVPDECYIESRPAEPDPVAAR